MESVQLNRIKQEPIKLQQEPIKFDGLSGACTHNFLNLPASHHPQNNFLFFIHPAYLIAFVQALVRSGYELPQWQRFKDYASEIFG